MIQNAFKTSRKMLKGNLHTHTNRSDGKLSPEDVINLYKENGYNFLALTDHRYYNFTNSMPDLGLTIIPGMEFDNGKHIPCEYGYRTFHTVCLGSDDKEINGFSDGFRVNSANAENQEEYQEYLDDIHSKNNITIYCHPEWSATPARYFDKMRGNTAMEIWNSACAIKYDLDKDAAYWDELLGMGIKLFGVASDDGHNVDTYCKAWIMVNAENNVKSILEAIKQGAFYSSTGPEIYDFRIEDGIVKIKCSPAKKIRIQSDAHRPLIKKTTTDYFTSFEYPINCDDYSYVRATVIDKDDRFAWTNPIFIEK